MQRLLIEAHGPGYPGDYLLSRIQGRSGALTGVTGALPAKTGTAERDDSRCWERAATERFWLFRQLDAELRVVLAPLFVFFELGPMATALRYQAGGRPGDADRVLQTSMLAPAIRAVLRGREGVAEVLSRLERSPAGSVLFLAGLRKSYSEGGLQHCEELLRRRFLMQALTMVRQRDLAFFCRAVVDIRNIIVVAKWLRWHPESVPALIPGGQVPLPRTGKMVTAEMLARMVRRWTHGLNPAGDQLRPEFLEPFLHAHLLRRLTRRRREGGVAAACIEYVWRGYFFARECSLRLHTTGETGP